MGSTTRRIGRTKARNIRKTKAVGNPKRTGKPPIMGTAIYFRENQDSPRTDPKEYKRIYTKEQAQEFVKAEIEKYKARREKRKQLAESKSSQRNRRTRMRRLERRNKRKETRRARRNNRRK